MRCVRAGVSVSVAILSADMVKEIYAAVVEDLRKISKPYMSSLSKLLSFENPKFHPNVNN